MRASERARVLENEHNNYYSPNGKHREPFHFHPRHDCDWLQTVTPLTLSLSSYHSFSLRHYLCYEESEASTHVPTSYHFPSSHMNATHPQFPLFSCFCRLLSIAPHREENTHRCYLCMDVCNYYVQETVSARASELWVGGVCLNE